MVAMPGSMLACLPLVLILDLAPIAPTPYDRVLKLEITEHDQPAIDGHGPTVFAEHEVDFEGTLHIWATSPLDLFLRVDDAIGAIPLASDDNTGGVTTPYLALDVHAGDQLVVLVAGNPGDVGPLTLHLIAAVETEGTRAAASAGWTALRDARQLLHGGDRTGAGELLVTAIGEILATPGAMVSDAIDDAAFQVALLAFDEVRILEDCRDVWLRSVRHRERTKPEDHADLIHARANLASVMGELGDHAGSRTLEESVVASCERTLPPDHLDLIGVRSNLALSMQESGDIAGARALQESVLAAYERVLPEDHPALLRAQANLANSMATMGDTAGARALEESIVASYERILPEDHPDLLRTRGNLARSMATMNDLAGAHALTLAVLAGHERSLPEGHPGILDARASLAVSLTRMGDHAAARALNASILAARELRLPQDHPEVLAIRLNLATSMEQTGDHAQGLALRRSALTAYERTLGEDHPSLIHARSGMAMALHDVGDIDAARAQLPALIEGMRLRILGSLTLAPRQARGAVQSEGVRHSNVVFLSESAGAELERSAFELTETMRLVAAEAERALSHLDGDPELAPIMEQAAQVRSALNDLVAGAAKDGTASPKLSADLAKLSLQRDRLEGEASRRLRGRGVATRAVAAEALAAALTSNAVAVGFRRIADWTSDGESGQRNAAAERMLAHVLNSAGTLARIDLGPAEELEELVHAWRAALGAPLLRGLTSVDDESEPELEAGRILRARILDPILARVGPDVDTLFVCADDLLFLLPLDALPGPESGFDRVGDQFRIVNEVSFARLLTAATPILVAPSLLALGGVDYDARGAAPSELVAPSAPIDLDSRDDGAESPGEDPPELISRGALPERFQRLLQARYEAEATADLFEEAFAIEPSLLTRKSTTKAALFELAGGKRYLHLATHGWFAPESVRSTEDAQPGRTGSSSMGITERVLGLAPMTLCGLALAGANNGRDSLGRVHGILTAEELCSLDLSQCDLAVLSACETNVGLRRAGQGIQSLQSALYAAGARTSITSLWKVDDAATRRLMEVFYTNLWIEELGKADALWQAKQALRDEGHPPAHWAGWVLTGDPK